MIILKGQDFWFKFTVFFCVIFLVWMIYQGFYEVIHYTDGMDFLPGIPHN